MQRTLTIQALSLLNVNTLPSGFPNKLKKGDTIGLAQSKAGVEIIIGGESKENETSAKVEGVEIKEIMGESVLDEGWLRRLPEVLRG